MKTGKDSFDFFFKSGMQVQLGGPLINFFVLSYQWPLLLTWFNFNPSMDM